MEPGPIKESDETFSDALLAQLLRDVVADWMAEPSLQALAVQDKEIIQWPADEKGQKRIPTALGMKLNCAVLLPIVGRSLQHYALTYVNMLEILLKKFRVSSKAQHLKVEKTEVKIDASSVNPDAHAIKDSLIVLTSSEILMCKSLQHLSWELAYQLVDMVRYVARQMQNNEVPYVVKCVRGKDPDSLDVALRTEAIWRTKSYKQKPAAVEDAVVASGSQPVPDAQEYVMPDSFPEDMLYEPRPVADAGMPIVDGPPGAAVPTADGSPDPLDAAMPDFDPFDMPVEDDLLDTGVHGIGDAAMPIADGASIAAMVEDAPVARPSVDAAMVGIPPEHETMQERYNRLAGRYGESAALALTGMVQEGWHYDPVAQQWSQLHGFVSPVMPAGPPDAPMAVAAEPLQNMEASASCVRGEPTFGLDDPLFETLSISSGLPESPKGILKDDVQETLVDEAEADVAAEGSHPGAGNEPVDEAKMFLLQRLQMHRNRIMAGSMPDNLETCPMTLDDALEKQRLFNGSSREAFPSKINIQDTPDGQNETLVLHNPVAE
ncbi:hypothetical protein AK812_SmicGene20964 [Symbiodinium microadriaticum]|uniref:Uncharacterized protein n=1 Tax=Symbiodinium microadriaticum TaxID=2951 RepID=A0A1Q9DNL6_SYMMI|nr:hypothetical protein AK812_SmicGene20964 [Symbiodinium microadriaticum]